MRWNDRRWGCSKRVAPSYAAVTSGALNIWGRHGEKR